MKEIDEKNELKPEKEDLINRRDALKKLGKHTAYTAPALMTLLVSSKVTAASPPPPPGG